MKALISWLIGMGALVMFWTCCFYCPGPFTLEGGEPCEPMEQDSPAFRKILVNDVGGMPPWAQIVSAGVDTVQWIQDFQEITDPVQALQDLVAAQVGFDTMLVLDFTQVTPGSGGTLALRFALFFTEPTNWQALQNLYIEWPGTRIWVWEKNPQSMLIGDMATGNDSAVVATIQQLPSWLLYGMQGSQLDSLPADNILGALLECKAGGFIRWPSYMPISAARLAQAQSQGVLILFI